jgi:predicted NBD/HSP70 family sugar kinase
LAQADLERLTGLSRPSVVNLLRRFNDILDRAPPRGGGTSGVVLSRAVGLALGIDFGHRHATVAISDLYGGLLASSETHVGSDPFGGRPAGGVAQAGGTSGGGPEQVDWAAAEVLRLLDELGRVPDVVAGAGIALPGPVDRNDEYAVIRTDGAVGAALHNPFQSLRPAVHLKEALVKQAPEWRNVPFHVDNDANLAALGERTWGLARDVSDVIYVDWSQGIGGGLILNGQVFRGTGAAGELGHLIVADAAESASLQPCPRCGNIGCLETVAGFERIASQLGPEVAKARGPDRVDAVIRLVGEGPAREHLRQAADYIAKALAPLITALNPQLVVIGGGFGTHAYDLIKNDLLEGIDRRTMPPANKDVTILGARPPRLQQLPEQFQAAARRPALLGALASTLSPSTESPPVISYLQDRV